MTSSVLERAATPPAGMCRYTWCVGDLCSADSNDNMHKGRPSEVPDRLHDYDVRACPMAYDFDDNTRSGPLVELSINDADNGYGVYANCTPADAYQLSAALVAAGSGQLPRGSVVTVRSEPDAGVAGGTITLEVLDEAFDMIVGLSVQDLRIPLVKVTVDGDGDDGMTHEECLIFDSCARDLGRYLQLAAFEVTR